MQDNNFYENQFTEAEEIPPEETKKEENNVNKENFQPQIQYVSYIPYGFTPKTYEEKKNLRKQIGLVLQESFLFSKTIEENILIARKDATKKELHHAAKIASVHDVIEEFDAGYQTMIGEATNKPAGTILSAGKKGIEVACGDGVSLFITELQAEGGKRMAASAYLLGHPIAL